jgi:hypothetical protein
MPAPFFPSPSDAVIAYRATPLEDIVDVHWGTDTVMVMALEFAVHPVTLPSSGPPLFFPESPLVMHVSVVNLPALSRTTLSITPGAGGGPPDPATYQDSVSGSFPIAPSGTIDGRYDLSQEFLGYPQNGSVNYTITGGSFAPGAFFQISENITLRDIFRSGGYDWTGHATFSGLSQSISGHAGAGGTINLTAVATVSPPSITLT